MTPPKSKHIWLIDAGHGGMIDGEYQTAGKRSPVWPDGSQYFEGVGNRQIASKLMDMLDAYSIPYFDILDGSQADVQLYDRVRKANQYQKIFGNCIYVSIHSDAFTKESANGYSVYTSEGQTKSDAIAQIFIDNMIVNFPEHKLRKDTRDGDYDKEAQFYVLRKTTSPAILIENFFMTNERECKLLMSETGQDRIVKCHFESIRKISFG